jgi:predicted neuraminidase
MEVEMRQMRPVILALGLLLLALAAQVAQADWQPGQRLTWTSGDSSVPRLAVDSSGSLHLVWEDDTPGNYDVYYKKSTDGGGTWTVSKRLTWTAGSSSHPAIAVDSEDTLHVVYDETAPGDYEIYYLRSADGGDTWSAPKRLTWTKERSWDAAIAVDSSDGLHVFWADAIPGNFEIYYKKSPDGGVTWSTNKRLTWTADDSFGPSIAVDPSGDLYAAWYDYTPGPADIYYKKSTDGGAVWSTTKRLTWTADNSFYPYLIAGASGHLYVAWEDETPGKAEIYFKKSSDGGAAWSINKRLTWNADDSWTPAIAFAPSGDLHLVWSDYTPGNSEIQYKKSTDKGATRTTTKRLTWTSGTSQYPVMAIDPSGNIHVVWSDHTPGNYEIYYKKGN